MIFHLCLFPLCHYEISTCCNLFPRSSFAFANCDLGFVIGCYLIVVKWVFSYEMSCCISFLSVAGGRLECTMQNIADQFLNVYTSRHYGVIEGTNIWDDCSWLLFNFFYSNQLTMTRADELDTFIVYNDRRKVTSSAKRKRRCGDKSLHQVGT